MKLLPYKFVKVGVSRFNHSLSSITKLTKITHVQAAGEITLEI